jgi:hypothetical protein
MNLLESLGSPDPSANSIAQECDVNQIGLGAFTSLQKEKKNHALKRRGLGGVSVSRHGY